MFNTKFILDGHIDIYPGYLNASEREKIKKEHAGRCQYMKCGCKASGNLYYKISEDLRLYPEHNNYVHERTCVRYKDPDALPTRNTAYLVADDGSITAYTSFDPFVYSPQTNVRREQHNEVYEDENIDEIAIEKAQSEAAPYKEPKLAFCELVRAINIDTYTEKVLNNQIINSKDYFSKACYHRMKKVKLARGKKNLGELTLEKDGCFFFYAKYINAVMTSREGNEKCHLITAYNDGKENKNFIFVEEMKKALDKFKATYNQEPDENTMVAGFQYLKHTKNGFQYKVIGRLHMFQVTDIGLYCNNNTEQEIYNSLYYISKEHRDLKFYIPPEDPSIGAIVELKGCDKKLLILFRGTENNVVAYDKDTYVPVVIFESTEFTYEGIKTKLTEQEAAA